MTDPLFTILMPVLRTPELMQFAINSVLNQTRGDFELFIVCDGAPPETMRAAEAFSARDARVRVFPFPKGEGHGEAHRHAALQQARGRYICGLADDDLWFPDHLDEIDALLSKVEFGNLLHANVMSKDPPLLLGLSDFGDPRIRARMMSESFNVFGPSQAGYRLETYRRLPIGWSPAAEGTYSDLAMWRKFIALPNLAAGTRFVFTSLHFATPDRRTWSTEERRKEIADYAALIATAQGRNTLRHWAFREIAREYAASHEYIFDLLTYREELKDCIELSEQTREEASREYRACQETSAILLQQMDLLKGHLAAAEKKREAELAAIRSSLSWRITAPLRSAARPFASWFLGRSKNR